MTVCLPAYSFPVSNSKVQHSGGFDNPAECQCVPEAFCTVNFTFFSFFCVYKIIIHQKGKKEEGIIFG